MAITLFQRLESANAIVFPPAPANISTMTVLDRSQNLAKSAATLLIGKVSNLISLGGLGGILRYWFRGDSEPCVVGHAYSFVISREDAVALIPVPGNS